MFYHVVRRPLHSNGAEAAPRSRTDRRSGSLSPTQLIPRYHYSRTATNPADVSAPSDTHPSRPTMTATAAPSNAYGSFTSTFIPFAANNRTSTPTIREFIQIPVNREESTPNEPTTLTRSVPITFITETNPLPSLENNNNPKPTFTSAYPSSQQRLHALPDVDLLRPSSRYFQHHFVNSNGDEPFGSFPAASARVPSATRRLSLSVPVVTSTAGTDSDTTHSRIVVSPIRQIPVRLPPAATSSGSRVSSAMLRSAPLSHALQRRRTDLGDVSAAAINNPPSSSSSSSSDFNVTSASTLPIRRAEAMARQAIQNISQQQQLRNGSAADGAGRSSPPPSSRRVIINLRNNQSVSLDSHLSPATKLPPLPFSPRSSQRNNVYHIPVLHELQMPPAESAVGNSSSSSYKNELRMEIPVTITTSNDQENELQASFARDDSFPTRAKQPRQALKSILKRSSSRETVSRKNVSFMNA